MMSLLKVKSADRSANVNGISIPPVAVPDLTRLVSLNEDDKSEVLEFLNARPVHTVVMASFLKDNGFKSEFNRGSFFGYRNSDGSLEGVALIGHSTLIEARTDEALIAFAIKARTSEVPIQLMMSEGRVIERFWTFYNQGSSEPRHVFTEKLFELNFPFLVRECEWEIGPATEDLLEDVARAHAEVAFIESGIDPLEADPEGFMNRCRRRMEQGRTFVATENGKLLFKADIVAETDKVVYLEGVYVAPEFRGKGIGPKCLSRLSAKLLERAPNLCMLSNLTFESAHRSFERAGFTSTDCCTTIFV